MTKQETEHKAFDHAYQLDVNWIDGTTGWLAVLTWYAGDEALISCTATDESITRVNEIVWQAMWRCQNDFHNGRLILPSMGDWEVRYWKTDK